METIQTDRPLRGKVQRHKGRGTGTKRKTQERTALPLANGFLKSCFPPMVMGKAYLTDWRQTEQDFFRSYHNFVARYGLSPVDYKGKAYPYNIALAFGQVKEYMEQHHCNEAVMIADHLQSKCCIATLKPYDTNMTLYYIPLRPLHRLLKDKTKRPQSNLLLCVFSYLLTIVRIPSYQYGDYVGSCYEQIKDCVESEPDEWAYERDWNSVLSDFKEADYFGSRLNRQLRNSCHLQQWETRINAFPVMDATGAALFMVAQDAYRLYLDYPKRTCYENMNPEWFFPEEEERTRVDQYISFTWSESGWLCDELFQWVNTEIQENGIVDEPLFIHTFDNPSGEPFDNLDFEKRLFTLFNNLSDILYTLSDEQHNTNI